MQGNIIRIYPLFAFVIDDRKTSNSSPKQKGQNREKRKRRPRDCSCLPEKPRLSFLSCQKRGKFIVQINGNSRGQQGLYTQSSCQQVDFIRDGITKTRFAYYHTCPVAISAQQCPIKIQWDHFLNGLHKSLYLSIKDKKFVQFIVKITRGLVQYVKSGGNVFAKTYAYTLCDNDC